MSTNHPWPNPYRKRPDDANTNPAFRYSRGFLPHIKYDGHLQMVTYRLADALPAGVADRLLAEVKQGNQQAEYRKKLEAYQDAGHGACWLRRPEIATIVRDSLLFFEGQRYHLHAWLIMPNHVHLVAEEISPHPLHKTVMNWKSFTAKQINQRLKRTGTVWQREHWDRYIRNQSHYENAMTYIFENPVKAGLVQRIEDWPWSSWGMEKKE